MRSESASNQIMGLFRLFLDYEHLRFQQLVYLTSDTIQLNDVLHIVDWESWSDDIIAHSYKNF